MRVRDEMGLSDEEPSYYAAGPMGRVFFFIREGLRALRRSAAPSLAAIVTIGVTVLLLGVLIPVLQTTNGKTDEVRDQLGLRVFLYDDATQAEIDALQQQLQGIPHVQSVEYVSPRTRRWSILSERPPVGRTEPTHRGARAANPLPASFNVKLRRPRQPRVDRARTLTPPGPQRRPRSRSARSSRTSTTLATRPSKITRAITGLRKIVLMVITALLLIASLLLVANTIRLSIYARRREVEVMRLVGATNWFIRWPFMVEGLVVGFVGGLSPSALLFLGKVTIVDPLSDDFTLIVAPGHDRLPAAGRCILLGVAMAVSALGSGLTLRRFLRI